MVDGAIAQALADADAQGISGKEVTPFLLSRLEELTGGASLEANIALVRNNASVAAAIAHAYAELNTETTLPPKPHLTRTRPWY
jgi:pseudouridylate synthase